MASHLIWQSQSTIDFEAGRLAAGGVDWVREDFPWEVIGRDPSHYDWAGPDRLMTGMARAGVKVLGIVDYTAPWASSDPAGLDKLFPPRDMSTFASYAAAITRRYGRNGTFWAQHPELRSDTLGALEIWNEPYGYWFWKPDPQPALYAQMVRAAATAVRAVEPGMPLLASGDLLQIRSDHTARPWLAQLLDADPGLASVIDAWSVHPYPSPWTDGPDDRPTTDYAFRRVEKIEALLAQRNARRPIWLTEFGWSTAEDSADAVSEARQASFLARALELANGPWRSFVGRSFVYSFDRSNGLAGDWDHNFGLRRADDSLKPAWGSLTAAAAGSSCP